MSSKETNERRRGALKAIFAGLVVAGAGGGLGYLVRDRHPTDKERVLFPAHRVRPPGAQNPETFEGACIRCGSCAQVCPRGAIELEHDSPTLGYGTPWVVPASRGCDLCQSTWNETMACQQVCPTGALQKTKREDVKMGLAEVMEGRCYPHTDRGLCEACVDACKGVAWAITLEKKLAGAYFTENGKRTDKYRHFGSKIPGRTRPVPVVDKTKCVGCGLCVDFCPYPEKAIGIRPRAEIV